tara:strand:+ start:727 stop:978 length:252 start_codon:yes stop_codon:yes gene_type:complete
VKKSELIGTKLLSGTWKFGETIGTVIKETADGYIVVDWENVNGEWYYTVEQFERFEKITDRSTEFCEETALLAKEALSKSKPS